MINLLELILVLCLLIHSYSSAIQDFTIFSPNVNTPIELVFSAPPQEAVLSITPNSTISLKTQNHTLLEYDPSKDTLSTNFDLRLGNDIILYGQPNDILFLDTEQWKLIYLEDFQGTSIGWSHDTLSSCGGSPDLFLGIECH